MVEKVQSAGGIVYYLDDNNEPRYLLIKRHALSKKVERIAPKGKIMPGETEEQAALREVFEEAGLDTDKLQIREKIDTLSLQLYNNQGELGIDKDITFFLMQYMGDPNDVSISDTEGFLGLYKWATIREVISLVIYKDLREMFRNAHGKMQALSVRDNFLKNF